MYWDTNLSVSRNFISSAGGRTFTLSFGYNCIGFMTVSAQNTSTPMRKKNTKLTLHTIFNPIIFLFHFNDYSERPPALPCEKQLICLMSRWSHTQHINQLLSKPPTYYWEKTIITSVNWTLQTRHTVDRGDMDIYFVMCRWSNTFKIITVIHCKHSYLCVSQGGAATLFRRGKWVYKYLNMWNFLRILFTWNYKNAFIFLRVLQNI